MTSSSAPEPKTEVGTVFREQAEKLRVHSEKEDLSIRNQSPPEWYRPDPLTTNLFDIPAMSEPYSREEQAEQFADVVKDPDKPGTTGDLSMVALQGDFVATMERAFRDRHMSPVRRKLHASGHRMGHSAETGVIQLGLVGFVDRLNEFNKSEFEGPTPAADSVLGDIADAGGIV